MIGQSATVIDWQGLTGRVRVQGEIWQARAEVGLQTGDAVTIAAVDDLTLSVTTAKIL